MELQKCHTRNIDIDILTIPPTDTFLTPSHMQIATLFVPFISVLVGIPGSPQDLLSLMRFSPVNFANDWSDLNTKNRTPITYILLLFTNILMLELLYYKVNYH